MLQPYKFITIIIEPATTHLDPMTRIQFDAGYLPVILDNDGYGTIAHETNSAKTVKPVIGILMENFPQEFYQAKVMVDGIAPIRVAASVAHASDPAIKAGEPIFWSENGAVPYSAIVDGANSTYYPYVGIALEAVPQQHGNGVSYVNVIIK